MNPFIIPLNDWAAGERNFLSHADLEFFQKFGNTEILDADVNVEIRVLKKSAQKVEADLHLSGTVTVPCDRCLSPWKSAWMQRLRRSSPPVRTRIGT